MARRYWAAANHKRGTLGLVFQELVSLPQLLAHPNFSLKVLLIQEEARRYDGTRNWRRKGWVTHERRLLQVVDRRLFETPADMRALIPASLVEPFTTPQLAEGVSAHPVLWTASDVQVEEGAGAVGGSFYYLDFTQADGAGNWSKTLVAVTAADLSLVTCEYPCSGSFTNTSEMSPRPVVYLPVVLKQ